MPKYNTMKFILPVILLSLCLLCKTATAQTAEPVTPAKEDTALYLRFPVVPPFTIYRVPDSSRFAKADLKKKKKTLLIIFSPDCDHCQQETRELTAAIDKFKNIQIVMASWLPYKEIQKFYTDYNIAAFPNITMGWDKSFFLPPFYKFISLPFMALYDKKGNLISVFEGSIKLEKVIAAFN
jgi:thioredoxin-related protein